MDAGWLALIIALGIVFGVFGTVKKNQKKEEGKSDFGS